MGKMLLFGRKSNGDGDVTNLEAILSSVLQPITPREEFIHSLKNNLLTSALSERDGEETYARKNIAMLILSLLGVTIILGMWIRMVIALLAALRIFTGARHGIRKRRVAVAYPTV